MKRNQIGLRFLLLLSMLFLAACGGGGESSPSPATATRSDTATPAPSPTTPADSSITKEIPGYAITMLNPAGNWRLTAGRVINANNRNISIDARVHPVPEGSSVQEVAEQLAGQSIEFEEEEGRLIGFALVGNVPTFYVDAGEFGVLAFWANMLLARESVPEEIYPELRAMALSAEIATR